MRLFHTELEAVYEEKNRGLDDDNEKLWEAIFSGLFQKHQYGTQTTIGTIEHLKNPSITKILDFYNTYYVPNNMAICMSGDFNPDSAIAIIRKNFEGLKSKPVPVFTPAVEDNINKPVVKEVFGPNAEEVAIAYRFAGANSTDSYMIKLVSKLLSNGKAGLFDLNLNQQQAVLNSSADPDVLKDYSFMVLDGTPKQGQSLDQVKDLLLAQVEKIKKGEFPDWLLSAIITNLKLDEIKTYEDNAGRARAFLTAFSVGMSWDDYVAQNAKLASITKQQVIDFVKDHFKENYVLVYKRHGEDKNIQKVEKPAITPVEVNRNAKSEFVDHMMKTPSPVIEPVFLDYAKDVKKFTTKNGVRVLYHENSENATFSIYYTLNKGSNQDKKLKLAIEYLNYLGTSKLSPEQVQQEFYKLGCSYGVECSEDETWISLTGLSENFEKALELFEQLLNDAQPNAKALENLVGDELKSRQDAMLDKETILFRAMVNYGKYGSNSPFTNILSEAELKQLKAEELIAIIKGFNSFEHRILYYGTLSPDALSASLEKIHKVPATLMPIPVNKEFDFIDPKNNVYVVNYDMKQAEIIFLSKSSTYDKSIVPQATLFNEYFGGGMASVVFQELRESKALAYRVFSRYTLADRKEKHNYLMSYIGTQSDKLPEAMAGMTGLMNEMPESGNVFGLSVDAILQKIRTERITRMDILFNYLKNEKLGVDYDLRKDVYTMVPKLTLDDVKKFDQQFIKNQTFTILVLGKKENLDLQVLKKYGKVNFLELKDVFGYAKEN